MPRFIPAALIAGLAVLAASAEAWAGQITQASGPIQVNGKPATLPVTLKKGDVVSTGGSTATFKSDAGDVISLERNTVAKSDGSEKGVEYLLIDAGGASGTLSEKTTLGCLASWATAPAGQTTEIRVEVPAEKPSEGRFRTIKGGTWLRGDPYETWLPADHSVVLWRDASKSGSLCFRTSQQNEGRVEIRKQVSGGTIKAFVPRASSGCYEDLSGNKTKLSNEITSNKQDKIQIKTEFGTASSAELGPGTYAIIDNQTGTIEVVEDVLDTSIGEELPTFDPVDSAADASASSRTKH